MILCEMFPIFIYLLAVARDFVCMVIGFIALRGELLFLNIHIVDIKYINIYPIFFTYCKSKCSAVRDMIEYTTIRYAIIMSLSIGERIFSF